MRAIHFAHTAASDRRDDPEVPRDDVAGIEAIDCEHDPAVEQAVRRGIRAQHAFDLGGHDHVAVTRALDQAGPLGGWSADGRLEDLAHTLEMLHASAVGRARVGHCRLSAVKTRLL